MIGKRYFINVIRKNSMELSPIKTDIQEEGKINNTIKSVIFDIYGTLFVSGTGDISITANNSNTEKLKKVLIKYKINKEATKVYEDYISSIKMEHEKLKARGIDFPEVKIDRIWRSILGINILKARKIAVEFESLVNPVWPMPYAFELINWLSSKRIALGIISNAQFYTPLLFEAFMGKSLSKLGFNKKLIFFSYMYQYAKPSKKLFLLADKKLKRYGIKSEDAVYIGNDMLNDIKPAHEIGFKTVLFAGDRRSLRLRENDEDCRDIKPDLIVTSLKSLMNKINV